MIKKADILQAGLEYLDSNGCAEKLVIAGLAAIASPKDIAKGFKDTHIKSHQLHLANGYFEVASAALQLAAIVDDGMTKQEKTFQRRAELVHGIVLHRRHNIQRALG